MHFSIKHELLIFESVEVLTGQFFAIHFPIYFSCDPNHHFHLSVCWIAANRLKFCKIPNKSRKYKVNNINNKVFSNYINLHHVSTRRVYIIASYRYINLVIPRHAGVELCYIYWKNVRRNCRKYWSSLCIDNRANNSAGGTIDFRFEVWNLSFVFQIINMLTFSYCRWNFQQNVK